MKMFGCWFSFLSWWLVCYEFPELMTLERAQDLYGLPTVGSSDDCIFKEGVEGCSVFVMTITAQKNKDKLDIPEVLLSGCLHGNKHVGPTAVMEAAKLLVLATSCYNSEEDVTCRQQLKEQWSIRSEDKQSSTISLSLQLNKIKASGLLK